MSVNGAELLERYAEMLRLTQQMLELAKRSEWDYLVESGHERAAIVEDLIKQEENGVWSQAEREKKGDLIRSILEADDEIKKLTQAWMGELQEILGSIGAEKKLSKAYETPTIP